MKPLIIFVGGVVALFGGLALVTSVTRHTTRVFVVVDSSFPMVEVWAVVEPSLDRVGERSHSEFALATEKDLVHSWQPALTLGSINAYLPCSFEGIEDHPEVAQADDRILITTDSSCDTSALIEWEVIFLEPRGPLSD